MGELYLYDIQKLAVPGHIPTAFRCFTAEHGNIIAEKTELKFKFSGFETIINTVTADPFNGSAGKRHAFIDNRQQMLALINSQRIRP